MSLIDEALKRAQSAGAQGEAPSAHRERPWVPTPMPDAGLARRRVLRRAVIAVLLAIAGAAGAYWLIARSPSGGPSARAQPAGRSLATTPALSSAPAVPTAFPISIVPTPPRANRGVAASAKSAEPVPAAKGAEAPAAPASAPHRTGVVSGRTYAGVVALSEGVQIELGGIVWSETEPRALINDRVMGVGSYVEGFTVSRIETDRVELQKDGVTIFLAVK
ncbi:MAG: hypothetical protein ABI968_00805 [Acidobacteriota bacterium]